MRILLTGATGYIGSAIARASLDAGHTVLALSHDETSAGRARSIGATPVPGDLRDRESLERAARHADAVIHAANTQAADAREADTAATETFVRTLRGSDRPFVYTSGVWVLGASDGDTPLDEEAPRRPTPLIAWRASLEERLVAAAQHDARPVIVRPGVVYGRAAGIPSLLVREAAETGRIRVVGSGRQQWPLVHVDDLASLYVRALEARAGMVFNGVSGESRPMREVALAACIAAGRTPVVLEWPLEEARQALGAFADALALNQPVATSRAIRELGWRVEAPSIIEELLAGSYATRRASAA